MSGVYILASISQDTHLFAQRKGRVWVASSGGFDPLHIGHVRMFEAAKELGDVHIVIINNDNWLCKKKGANFMPEQERVELIRSLRSVDGIVLTQHSSDPYDMSVSNELRFLRPDIFVNGGDRKEHNTPEDMVCSELDIQMEFNVGVGGKIQSSSWLLEKYNAQV